MQSGIELPLCKKNEPIEGDGRSNASKKIRTTLQNYRLMQRENCEEAFRRNSSNPDLETPIQPVLLGLIVDLVTSNTHPYQEITYTQMLRVHGVSIQCSL